MNSVPAFSPPDIASIADLADRLRARLNSILLGKPEVIELVLACLLARGHLLFDDLPGLGKTTLAKAIAAAVGGKFSRVQCTPDLLPTDVTGFNIFNQQVREFQFVAGPVFADVMLADEINRATPRTQSSLFEAMAERQVTIDTVSRPLSRSFFVIATQNPVESLGAYPLPEAQLDRFSMKLRIGYPDRDNEVDLLEANIGAVPRTAKLDQPIVQPELLAAIQDQVAGMQVSKPVRQYIVDLSTFIRNHPVVRLGVSPRGLIIWQRVAQAWACLHGRDFVTPDDVREVALATIGVRIVGEFDQPDEVIQKALADIRVPLL